MAELKEILSKLTHTQFIRIDEKEKEILQEFNRQAELKVGFEPIIILNDAGMDQARMVGAGKRALRRMGCLG